MDRGRSQDDDGRSRRELLEEIRALRGRVAELGLPNADPVAGRVRALLEQIPAIVWTTDRDMRLTWWRGGGIQVIGFDVDAQLGVSVTEFFGTESVEHPAVQAHRAALEGEARRFEVAVEFDGNERWLRAHIEPLRDPGQTILGAIGVALDITDLVRAETERERLIDELQRAADRVKTLSGLIPICAHCKSMRDDRGYWQHVEAFLRDHSDAELSHGICPECAEKLLPSTR